MFTTIVVGTDGSRGSQTALRAAATVASATEGSVVHVVTAYRPLSPGELNRMRDQLPDEFKGVITADAGAADKLAEAEAILDVEGVAYTGHEIGDDPTDAILDVADQVGADLIVVGSRGEGTVKRALHGSVSTKVVHNAPCTVMVVQDDH